MVDLVEEVNATLVTTALKLGVEPLVDDHLGELGAHDAGAKGEHVGIVVHAGELGAEGLGAHDGAYALDLVGSQTNPDTSEVSVPKFTTSQPRSFRCSEMMFLSSTAAWSLPIPIFMDGSSLVCAAQMLKVFTAFDCMIARLLRKRSSVFWSNALAGNKTGFS